jgi:hypothetical protein
VDEKAKAAARSRNALKLEAHAVRKRQLVELRRSGKTFDACGEMLGISGQAARKLYRSALKDFYRTASVEERETALLRCDGIIERWWRRLLSEDDEVADRATKNLMRAMNFQADLWGMRRNEVDLTISGGLAMQMPSGSEVWQALQDFRAAARDGQVEVPPAHAIPAQATVAPSTNGHDPEAA